MPLLRAKGRYRLLLLKLLHPQIAELDARAVAEEAEVAALARQAGVLVAIDGFAAGGDLIQIGIDDRRAVEHHPDAAAVGRDLFRVPLAHRLQMADLGGGHAVDRA